MTIKVGHILRHEDESGISGTGVVAEWVEYSDGEVVVHWISNTPSTNHYRNLKQVEAIHGHGGKTEMVTIWEQPRPETIAEDSIIIQAAADAGEEQSLINQNKLEPKGKAKVSQEKEPPSKSSSKKKKDKPNE